MNTPPQRKRHSPTFDATSMFGSGVKGASGSIEDAAIAALLGKLAAAFTHLESSLAQPLATLSGMNRVSAGYVLRAIKSPRGRVDLMRDLLQKSPLNESRGEEWDALIREFQRLNGLRNDYVHAHWWSANDGTTWASIWDEHGMTVYTAKPVNAETLQAVILDIGKLQYAFAVLAER